MTSGKDGLHYCSAPIALASPCSSISTHPCRTSCPTSLKLLHSYLRRLSTTHPACLVCRPPFLLSTATFSTGESLCRLLRAGVSDAAHARYWTTPAHDTSTVLPLGLPGETSGYCEMVKHASTICRGRHAGAPCPARWRSPRRPTAPRGQQTAAAPVTARRGRPRPPPPAAARAQTSARERCFALVFCWQAASFPAHLSAAVAAAAAVRIRGLESSWSRWLLSVQQAAEVDRTLCSAHAS